MHPYTTNAQTTLAKSIVAGDNTMIVTNGNQFPRSGAFRIKIDGEIILVMDVNGTTWRVERAVEPVAGSRTPAPHTAGASVQLVNPSGFDEFNSLYLGGGGGSANGNTGNVTGCDNVAIGQMSFDQGVANTKPALNAVTDGEANIAIGSSALSALTTGNGNTAIGESPMLAMLTGSNNIGIGGYALNALTANQYNIAIGYNGMAQQTSGDGNIGIGHAAGFGNVSGAHNVYIGRQAGVNSANNKSYAICLGYNGQNSGDYGIAIGYQANANGANAIAIGKSATANNANQCSIGGTGSDALCLIWAGTTAPADGDLAAGQFAIYWDSTNGAAKLKIKGKSANGTVVTGSVSLS